MRLHEFSHALPADPRRYTITRLKELLESPQAMEGDFEPIDGDDCLRMKAEGFMRYWTVVGQMPTQFGNLAVARGKDSWVVGSMAARDDVPDREEFRALIRLDGEVPNRRVPYSNPIIVRFVYVAKNERVSGLAVELYKFLVQDGHTLIGDAEQYFGARRLWSRLSQLQGYHVDLLNIYTADVLDVDVNLHQGQDEMDYDKAVWSRDEQLVSVRPVFRKAA